MRLFEIPFDKELMAHSCLVMPIRNLGNWSWLWCKSVGWLEFCAYVNGVALLNAMIPVKCEYRERTSTSNITMTLTWYIACAYTPPLALIREKAHKTGRLVEIVIVYHKTLCKVNMILSYRPKCVWKLYLGFKGSQDSKIRKSIAECCMNTKMIPL